MYGKGFDAECTECVQANVLSTSSSGFNLIAILPSLEIL